MLFFLIPLFLSACFRVRLGLKILLLFFFLLGVVSLADGAADLLMGKKKKLLHSHFTGCSSWHQQSVCGTSSAQSCIYVCSGPDPLYCAARVRSRHKLTRNWPFLLQRLRPPTSSSGCDPGVDKIKKKKKESEYPKQASRGSHISRFISEWCIELHLPGSGLSSVPWHATHSCLSFTSCYWKCLSAAQSVTILQGN